MIGDIDRLNCLITDNNVNNNQPSIFLGIQNGDNLIRQSLRSALLLTTEALRTTNIANRLETMITDPQDTETWSFFENLATNWNANSRDVLQNQEWRHEFNGFIAPVSVRTLSMLVTLRLGATCRSGFYLGSNFRSFRESSNNGCSFQGNLYLVDSNTQQIKKTFTHDELK